MARPKGEVKEGKVLLWPFTDPGSDASSVTLKPESAQSFASCLYVRGCVDPGYCAGFETGGVLWRGVQVCDHLRS